MKTFTCVSIAVLLLFAGCGSSKKMPKADSVSGVTAIKYITGNPDIKPDSMTTKAIIFYIHFIMGIPGK
ncbi:MAG: hypothetical protein LBH82_06500 [Bacteroidales bacterium]|jgi:uncharacterized protein YcfL|nr:hypothetical protein [Bacteroidales bacterium]